MQHPIKQCFTIFNFQVGLNKTGYNVYRILKNKTIKTRKEIENVLLEKYQKKLPSPSLFELDVDESQIIKEAYKLHNKEIGWIANKVQEYSKIL